MFKRFFASITLVFITATLIVVVSPVFLTHNQFGSEVYAADQAKDEPQDPALSIDPNDPKLKLPPKLKSAMQIMSKAAELPLLANQSRNEDDKFCKDRLNGTMSYETCSQICPKPDVTCKVVQTHKAEYNPSLESDLNCYGCAALISCYDMGYMYAVDCPWTCTFDPRKMCVAAIPVPGLGIGPTSFPIPRDTEGTQCYDCVAKPDKCGNVWPGSTYDITCGGAACPVATHDCVFKGMHPDGYGCYACEKKVPPKKKDCYDKGAMYNTDCGTCQEPWPECKPVPGLFSDWNEQCWDCWRKEERKPPKQPPQPPATCESVTKGVWHTPSCQCKDDEEMVFQAFSDGQSTQLNCCRCVKNQCHPNMYESECKLKCENDPTMQCVAMTTVRGEVPCYYCAKKPQVKDPPSSCADLERPDDCSKMQCSANEKCEMVEIQVGPPEKKKTIKCPECVPTDEVNPADCEQYGGVPDCASCYLHRMGCKTPPKKVREEPPLFCYSCEDLTCPLIDGVRALPGDCASNPGVCGELECIDTEERCHLCRESPPCGGHPGYYTSSNCEGQCKKIDKVCVPEFRLQGEEQCYYCEDKATCEEDGLYSSNNCNGQCEANQACVKELPSAFSGNEYRNTPLDCYECIDKCDVEEGEYPDNTCGGACDGDLVCLPIPGSDFGCHHCAPRPKNCADYQLKNLEACEEECHGDDTRECKPTSMTPSGEQCYQCLTKDEWFCDPQKGEFIRGKNCMDACDPETQKCETIAGNKWGCQHCVTKPGYCEEFEGARGVCPQQCSSGQNCVDDGICWWCESTDCRELFPDGILCADCESCEADGVHVCTSTFLKQGGESCCRCQVKNSFCAGNNVYPAGTNCNGECHGDNMECKPIPGNDYGCEGCVEKPVECDEHAGQSRGRCPQQCPSEEECADDGSCWWCKEKPKTTPVCDREQGEFSGNCPQECFEDYECKDIPGKPCHQCADKPRCDKEGGWLPGNCMMAMGEICGFGRICVESTDGNCHKCATFDTYCEDPFKNGQCPQECPEGQTCQNMMSKCYNCVPNDQVWEKCDDGRLEGDCPASGECSDGSTCVPAGAGCHMCQPKETPPPAKGCDDGLFEGSCPASGKCADGGNCLPVGMNCHTCVPKETTFRDQTDAYCYEYNMWSSSNCDGECYPDEECVPESVAWNAYGKQNKIQGLGLKANLGYDYPRFSDYVGEGAKIHTEGRPQTQSAPTNQPAVKKNEPGRTVDTRALTKEERLERIAAVEKNIKNLKEEIKNLPPTADAMGKEFFEANLEKAQQELNRLRGLAPGFFGSAADMDGDGIADMISGYNFPIEEENNGEVFNDGVQVGDPSTRSQSAAMGDALKGGTKDQPKFDVRNALDTLGRGNTGGVNYYSPSFTGYQLGLGYTPDKTQAALGNINWNDSNPECYTCIPKKKYLHECPGGMVIGGGGMGQSNQMCYTLPNGCMNCQNECPDGAWPYKYCGECIEDGGKCVPAMTLGAMFGKTPLCFDCAFVESCEKYDLFSNCYECYDDEHCVPSNVTVLNPITKKPYQCVDCIPYEYIEEITWVTIIIETPFGRIKLKRGPMDFADFTPSKIMALAKVEPGGKIANAQGALQEISSFMKGGLGSAGILSSQVMNLESMAGLLQQSMDKGNNFAADCFNEIEEKATAESAAEPAKTKKSKGEETPAVEDLKESDAAGDVAVTGPVVACGNTQEKKKALNVYDAGGSLVQSITKEDVKNNPTIIQDVLKKAQQQTENYLKKQIPSIGGLIQKFTGLPVGQMQQAAAKFIEEGKKKKKKSEPVKITTPNDPLYQFEEVKKKKLLGILGSSTDAGKGGISIGTSLTFGIDPERSREGGSTNTNVKDQWGLHTIGFTPTADPDSAWNVVDPNQKNVIVAVIDSGLDFNHPDGPQYLWVNEKEIPGNGKDDDGNGYTDDINGWNFLNDNHDFTDICGHGTFVVGIIAAKANNDIGIAGINPGAVIMPLKVADEEGETNSLHIYRAIQYAVAHGARVINISLGARGISTLEQAAINNAWAQGVFVAVASGNVNENITEHGPASANYVTAVGSIDVSGERSTISNWGPNNGLLAPGDAIYSLCSKDNKHVLPSIRESGYYTQSGTSFSTPMVAATASLMLAKNPKLTNTQVQDMLFATADDIYEAGWDGESGFGILNAQKALRAAPGDFLTVMITDVRMNEDYKKTVSVDVFGTIRGPLQSYTLEVGKGKRANRFEAVTSASSQNAEQSFLGRIEVKEYLKGSDDWVLRINAKGRDGQMKFAATPLTIAR